MHKWLATLFIVVVAARVLFVGWSWPFRVWAAVIVLVGGGILLTLIGYAQPNWSMPRPASFWLQLWYPDQWAEKMPPASCVFYRILYWPSRPKDAQ